MTTYDIDNTRRNECMFKAAEEVCARGPIRKFVPAIGGRDGFKECVQGPLPARVPADKGHHARSKEYHAKYKSQEEFKKEITEKLEKMKKDFEANRPVEAQSEETPQAS